MTLPMDLSMVAGGFLAGLGGGAWLSRRGGAWLKVLLACGPAGILAYLGWLEWDRGPGLTAAFGLLAAFVTACDRLCAAPRPRHLFLLLCGVAGVFLLSQTWGRLSAMRALGAGAVQDGVVLQSTGFSCFPASAATCLLSLGIPATEAEMASEGRTTECGTGDGPMISALNRRLAGIGWEARIDHRDWEGLPRDGSPAVLSVDWHGIPHAIAFLGFEWDRAVIGEPQVGRVLRTRAELDRVWDGEGIFFARR